MWFSIGCDVVLTWVQGGFQLVEVWSFDLVGIVLFPSLTDTVSSSFSQSLATLSYVEALLSRCQVPIPHASGDGSGEVVQFSQHKWIKNKNYCRK